MTTDNAQGKYFLQLMEDRHLIHALILERISIIEIARKFDVSYSVMYRFIKSQGLDKPADPALKSLPTTTPKHLANSTFDQFLDAQRVVRKNATNYVLLSEEYFAKLWINYEHFPKE